MKIWVIAVLVALMTACGGDSEPSATTSQSAAEGAAAEVDMAAVGEEVYNNFCASCHNPGLSGAPRLGDVEAWAPRIAKGNALLLESTIAGVQPAMPPRGMCFSCSDEDLAAAVDYMVGASQ